MREVDEFLVHSNSYLTFRHTTILPVYRRGVTVSPRRPRPGTRHRRRSGCCSRRSCSGGSTAAEPGRQVVAEEQTGPLARRWHDVVLFPEARLVEYPAPGRVGGVLHSVCRATSGWQLLEQLDEPGCGSLRARCPPGDPALQDV